jgi:hypothetical protein
MPRLNGKLARARASALWASRWRYLLRNPTFQRDLNEVRRQGEAAFAIEIITEQDVAVMELEELDDASEIITPLKPVSATAAYDGLLNKWHLTWLPEGILRDNLPDLSPPTVRNYEAAVIADFKHNSSLSETGYPFFRRAVTSRDPAMEYYTQTQGTPHPSLNPLDVIDLRIDLSQPQDVIEELVKDAVRCAKEKRNRSLGKKTRKRPDKVQLYLTVYDLVSKGHRFSAVARDLRKSKSTIQSIWATVSRHIQGDDISHKEVSMQAIEASTFDMEQHLKECKICQVADTADAMCSLLRAYIQQDQVSQHDEPRDMQRY